MRKNLLFITILAVFIFSPVFVLGRSHCASLNKDECKNQLKDNRCIWKPKKGGGGSCQNPGIVSRTRSSQVLPKSKSKPPQCSGKTLEQCLTNSLCQWVFDPSTNTGKCRPKVRPKVGVGQSLFEVLRGDRAPGQAIKSIRPGQAVFDSDVARLKKSFSPGQAVRFRLKLQILHYLNRR